MMKMGHGFPTVSEWSCENLQKGDRIGFDPALVSAERAKLLISRFEGKGLEFVPIDENLVNKVWKERPPMSFEKVFVHHLTFAGTDFHDKLNQS